MNSMTSAHAAELERARRSNGQFGTHAHTDPEVSVGAGRQNVYAEPFDLARGERPLRPYLALTSSDDDEVFDCPDGTVINASVPSLVRRYERVQGDLWHEKHVIRGTVIAELTTGEVWQSLFDEEGAMHDALLSAPHGTLYSDAHGFVVASDIDQPLPQSEALRRVSETGQAQMVSRSSFGTFRDDGVPLALQGTLAVTTTRNNDVAFQAVGGPPHAQRGFPASAANAFDRDGDIVFRSERNPRSGWEEVFRVIR